MNVSIVDSKCTGCGACMQRCPVQAITFSTSAEGFAYPVISDACTDCGACLRTCHTQNSGLANETKEAYAAYLNDATALQNSSSGGVFAALARAILQKGGVVFGCAELAPGDVRHVCIDSVEQLPLLQGSKYVESNLQDSYTVVRRLLNEQKRVLFSGTPCQIAGLRTFIGENANLYTADIVCHGVPSQTLYRTYLQWEAERGKGEVTRFVFRSKEKHGWSLTYRMEQTEKNRVYVQEHLATMSPYYDHFLKALNYRESCYQCRYASAARVGDLTLCDLWGVETIAPDMANFNGVSGVLINTEKGAELWAQAREQTTCEAVPAEQIVENNGQLRKPSVRPAARDAYYTEVQTQGFHIVAKKYTPTKSLVIDALKDCVPNKYRVAVKKAIRKLR